jgi:N-acetylneuraminic acid mutarotase
MKYLLLTILLFTGYNCQADYWTRKADFPGGNRDGAYSFVINGKAYVGGGFDSTGNRTDMWEYDPTTNSWTKKSDFPQKNTYFCVHFAIGNNGFVGLGYTYTFSTTDSLFKYNSITDTWSPIPCYPSGNRAYATAFVLNNIAYVGTGLDTYGNILYTDDFYSYNPSTNAWDSVPNMPLRYSFNSVAFTIEDTGYVIGLNVGGGPTDTLFAYYSCFNQWFFKKSIPADTPRADAIAFSIGKFGYFGTGDCGSGTFLNDFYEYNSLTNSWNRKAPIPLAGVDEATAFSIGLHGYICFEGEGGHLVGDTAQLWEYTPDFATSINTIYTLEASAYPNPFTTQLIIQTSAPNTRFNITDMSGKLICYGTTVGKQEVINTATWRQGTYFVELVSPDGGREVRKVVK